MMRDIQLPISFPIIFCPGYIVYAAEIIKPIIYDFQ